MTFVPPPVRRLLQSLGINRPVAYALIGQGWTMLFQPVTLFMIANFMTRQEQGYYSAFGSFVALQMFFDLGLGQATLQFISYEAGHLHWTEAGTLAGDPVAKSRLVSIVRLSLGWYLVIAAVLTVVLLPVGWGYFLERDTGEVSWAPAWAWTVPVTTAGLLLVPPMHLLAACGRIADTTRFQSLQKAAVGVAQCLALAAGWSLLSWPAAQTLGLVMVTWWLTRLWGPAFRDLLRQPADGPKVHWWREVWPFQWKVAVSGMAYYLTYPFCTLVLFDDTPAGKEEAGRMGMSLAITSIIMSSTLTWIGARVPTFGQMVGRREWDGLDRLFRPLFVRSTMIAVALAAVAWAVLVTLQIWGYEMGSRVLPALPLGLLLANAVVQHMVHALSSYLRAHKKDPFLWLTVGFGVAAAAAVVTVGRTYGSIGMAASLLTLNSAICLGGGGLVFARCRRAWHAESVPPFSADPVTV